MNGITQVIYPVNDIGQAKPLFRALLGVDPYMDEPYYVGFRIGDQEIGLDPNAQHRGITGPLGYFEVADIAKSIRSLLDAGAQEQQAITDVGGGKLIASVRDADGNLIGLVQAT